MQHLIIPYWPEDSLKRQRDREEKIQEKAKSKKKAEQVKKQ
jgi:hypothetical protein